MPTRRALKFPDFDSFAVEVLRLRNSGCTMAGQWTLSQNCEHLKSAIDQSMDGFAFRMPWFMRLVGKPMLWFVSWQGSMPKGVKGPPQIMPSPRDMVDDKSAADALLATIRRYQAFDKDLSPSPLFGAMTREQWDRIHLIHAAHHLSFAVPSEAR